MAELNSRQITDKLNHEFAGDARKAEKYQHKECELDIILADRVITGSRQIHPQTTQKS